MKSKRVVVGVSGGVDSSMSLVVLQQKAYAPVAVSLKLPVWKKAKCKENSCCTDKSIAIAKDVCQKLEIEHHIVDERKNFEKEVVNYFKKELKNNRTPNPCVICNRYSKFKALFDFANKHKIKYVATGHYAKIKNNQLLKPKDETKDQTYGLCLLPRSWLKRIIFPLQDMTKDQVYALAQKQNFDYFSKIKQSQDFCFVSGKDLFRYLEKEFGKKSGDIIDPSGKVIGKHRGLWFYTIGQRKGLNIKSRDRYFVCGYNPKANQLIVTNIPKSSSKKEIIITNTNLISALPKTTVDVKIRYTTKSIKAKLIKISSNKIKVIFSKPQELITPGQFCVFYKGNVCLGGGIIK